ncbi:hypothetical protein OIU85_017719 [Salix viminalis]|uniref:Uncharacterized protein n=1 Tax=Salix viminalis TaxID=40686 RepID=A0A9Q0ZRA1_SALVM|nr:hypothetical protein OIU85_017719 [Salix viminalis]
MVVKSDLETGPINFVLAGMKQDSLFPSPSEEILSISSSEGLSLPDYTDFLGAWRKKHLLAKRPSRSRNTERFNQDGDLPEKKQKGSDRQQNQTETLQRAQAEEMQ